MDERKSLNSLSWKVKRRIIYPLAWSFLFGLRGERLVNTEDNSGPYTICVTTFLFRFESCLKPLVRKLAYLFPNHEIIILVNGHYERKAQEQYIRLLKAFLARFPKIKLVYFIEPQGLSLLWNLAVKSSTNDRIFIFNDDTDMSVFLKKEIEESSILEFPIVTHGYSWSQFMIDKSAYREIGPFDEGLKEIGGEDDDYLIRMKLQGIEPHRFPFRHLWSKNGGKIRINSYGKVPGEQVGGYSTYNTNYLEKKWEKSLSPIKGGVFVRGHYWKLRVPQ